MRHLKLAVLAVIFSIILPLTTNAQAIGYVGLKVSPNSISSGESSRIEWTGIGVDYYLIKAECPSGVQVKKDLTASFDLCKTARKTVYGGTNSYSIGNYIFINESGSSKNVKLNITAYKDSKVIQSTETTVAVGAGNGGVVSKIDFNLNYGGDKLGGGSLLSMDWTSVAVDTSKRLALVLRSADAGVLRTIATGLPLNSSYTWTIPYDIPTATDYVLSLDTNDKGPTLASNLSKEFAIYNTDSSTYFIDNFTANLASGSGNNGTIIINYEPNRELNDSHSLLMNIDCPWGLSVQGNYTKVYCKSWVYLDKNDNEYLLSYDNVNNLSAADISFTLLLVENNVTKQQKFIDPIKLPISPVVSPFWSVYEICSSGVPSGSFKRDLTLGSTGEDVVQLQTILEATYYLVMPVGVPKGYFGEATRLALSKFQKEQSINPADGYFGPVTRFNINLIINNCSVLPDAIEVDGVSTSAEVDSAELANDNDWGVYTIKFDVTAVDSDIYIFSDEVSLSTTPFRRSFDISINGNPQYIGTTSLSTVSSTSKKVHNAWLVSKGNTERFTITTRLDPIGVSSGNAYSVKLNSVSFMPMAPGRGTTTKMVIGPEFETNPIFID